MKLRDKILLRAAQGEKTTRIPVWIMRQAGRIIPEYRKLREKTGSFLKLIETPELAAEVTLQPVRVLGVDGAIIFSDILVVPKAMGMALTFTGKGPVFRNPIRSARDINALETLTPASVRYVTKALQLVKKELDQSVTLIGFAGSPWTVFAFMAEGHSSRAFTTVKRFLHARPQESRKLLEILTRNTILYLREQAAAGAEVVQIFDTLAGLLSPPEYFKWSLPFIRNITRALKQSNPRVPVIVYSKGAGRMLNEIVKLKPDVLGLDWSVEPCNARKMAGKISLQGNLNPEILLSSKTVIKNSTHTMISQFGKDNYIANLGHGVLPETPLDHVKIFVDSVKNFN